MEKYNTKYNGHEQSKNEKLSKSPDSKNEIRQINRGRK